MSQSADFIESRYEILPTGDNCKFLIAYCSSTHNWKSARASFVLVGGERVILEITSFKKLDGSDSYQIGGKTLPDGKEFMGVIESVARMSSSYIVIRTKVENRVLH